MEVWVNVNRTKNSCKNESRCQFLTSSKFNNIELETGWVEFGAFVTIMSIWNKTAAPKNINKLKSTDTYMKTRLQDLLTRDNANSCNIKKPNKYHNRVQ